MEIFTSIIQITVGILILNVWTIRAQKPTAWRGGDAKNMKEEFTAYGLPTWLMAIVGWLKIIFALMLISGVWISGLTKPAAAGLAVLMIGAIIMHAKIKDPVSKSYPASGLLVLCTFLITT